MEDNVKKIYIYTNIKLGYSAVQQKLTEHYKSTIIKKNTPPSARDQFRQNSNEKETWTGSLSAYEGDFSSA